MKEQESGLLQKIWNFCASIKLAIVVLLLLAITSIVGTVLPQEDAKAIQFLAKVVGDNTAPTLYNIFVTLDFMDMYHAWWFKLLLFVFCINLIVCSLDKLPRVWHIIQTPLHPLEEHVIKNLQIKKELKVKASIQVARDEFLNTLKSKKYQPLEATEGDSVQMYSQKGRYTRLGVYIVHLSILLIFVGALVGAQFGFDGYLNLPEGSSSGSIYTFDGKTIPLDFMVKCNWYNTTYYEGSYRPQEFQSELVVIEDGKEVLTKAIEVNDPLTYKGITFYQSNYGSALQMYPNISYYPSSFGKIPIGLGAFILNMTPEGGQPQTIRLQYGESFQIPGTGIKGTIADFSPALSRDPGTNILYTFDDQMMEPAIAIQIEEPGKAPYTGWFLQRHPETWLLDGGHSIEFVEYWGMEYTGLQVSKDPGVWIIYLACIIMSLGLYVTFFMSNKKIWVRLVNEKNSVSILIGGSATKNRLSFEQEIESILSKTSEAIEARSTK
ncbi:MAG: cytochrome c biogenesis protein ResB [Thermodesulfovibrionia bacterium]|nr:cytochrome c biogenesis protein ResB [Thermodesulfovibrionia bacterium]